MKLKYLLILCAFSCICYAQHEDIKPHPSRVFSLPDDTTFFYDFWVLMDNYGSYYCEYPDSIDQAIEFANALLSSFQVIEAGAYNWFCYLNCVYYFNLYKNDISFIKKDGILELTYIKNGISETASFGLSPLPCDIQDFLDNNILDYFRIYEHFKNPRFFYDDNRAIIRADELSTALTSYALELQNEYLHKDSVSYYYSEPWGYKPIYLTLEFRPGQKLVNFCDKQKEIPRLTYYIKLEEALEVYCRYYNLSRIVFMSRDYLLSAEKTED